MALAGEDCGQGFGDVLAGDETAATVATGMRQRSGGQRAAAPGDAAKQATAAGLTTLV
jgi:hypothetical protein